MKGFTLLGYCILPDHVHVLVMGQRALERARWVGEQRMHREVDHGGKQNCSEPNAEGVLSRAPGSVGDLMRSMKGTFSRTLIRGHIWQRRYHLRHVMSDVSLINVVDYIQFNSRKHGLPERFGQEPYVWINTSILKRML